jgi:hypothetical protein
MIPNLLERRDPRKKKEKNQAAGLIDPGARQLDQAI